MFNKKSLNGGFLPLFIPAAKMAQAFLRRAIFLCNNQPLYESFFLKNNITIVTAQDSHLIISCLRVTIEAFSIVT